MAKPVKLGLVGAGSIAIRSPLAHISVGDVSDQIVFGAICDPVPGRAKAAAEKFGVPQHFESFDEMIAKGDFDVATVCSPIGIHYEQGMKLVNAGKHIHFNKTMTTTSQEATDIIEAAKQKNVKLVASPGQMLRPQNRRIRKLIQEGAIGDLCWSHVGAGFHDYHENERVRSGNDVLSNIDPSWYWRKPGGGPLYDMTVYGLHTMTGVLGPAKRVTAMSGVRVKEREFKGKKVQCDADDNTMILIDFGSSVFAYVYGMAHGSIPGPWGMPQYFGTKGNITGIQLNGKKIEYPGSEKDEGGSGIALTKHAGGKHGSMEEMHVYEDLMQLVDWVREGIPSIVTAEHARHVVEIFEAAYKAAETGQTQTLKTTFTAAPGE